MYLHDFMHETINHEIWYCNDGESWFIRQNSKNKLFGNTKLKLDLLWKSSSPSYFSSDVYTAGLSKSNTEI